MDLTFRSAYGLPQSREDVEWPIFVDEQAGHTPTGKRQDDELGQVRQAAAP